MVNNNKHHMGRPKIGDIPKTGQRTKSGQKKKHFSPECYFMCPETGQPGWTIDFPSVKAYSKEEAAEMIKAIPNFDCFIEDGWEKFND